MNELLSGCSRILWGSGLVLALLGTGMYSLLRDRCAPFRSLRLLIQRPHRNGTRTLSPFQACMTSLAAAMGTGNIVGVATAITLGGAGAIFWMWVAALLGMGLIYAENVLSCRYRSGGLTGAAAYLRYGLHSPLLSAAFAVCCTAASFGMGNMTQSHAIAQTLRDAFRMPPLITGLITAAVTAAVILGGARRIGRFASAAVPFVSAVYLLLCGIVIWQFRSRLGDAFGSIFQGAFGIRAAAGGISGEALRRAMTVGVRRGVFSNEAGLGSSGLLHGEADGEEPAFFGACGMLEVFADTFVCCTATALVLLMTGVSGADGAGLVLLAFRAGIGTAADWLLPPVIALFALCTLVGWAYCGSSAWQSLTGKRWVTAYRLVFCAAACLGAVMQLETVWTLADIANACMVYCNLPGLLLLQHGEHLKSGKAPFPQDGKEAVP